MNKEGTVVRFDEARGFGFIRSLGTSADVFFHVRDYRSADGGSPRQGQRVTFDEIHVGGKGPRAMAVRAGSASVDRRQQAQPRRAGPPLGSSPRSASVGRRAPPAGARRPPPGSGAWWMLPALLCYAVFLLAAVWARHLPWWVLPLSFVVNAGAFFAYWLDKDAAARRRWRIPESTLHAWSLAGGWGGAWCAQQALRHKSSKRSFQLTFMATVWLHGLLLGAWLWWRVGAAPA